MSMKKYIKFVLLILWMALIFFFSSQVSNDSTATTNIVIDMLYKIYRVFVIPPKDIVTFTEMVFKPVRKLAHFAEFAILGLLIYINVKDFKTNKTILLSAILSFLYAVSDEIHQIFVPGRACTFVDMLIDLSGAIVGILFIHLILKRWKKQKD